MRMTQPNLTPTPEPTKSAEDLKPVTQEGEKVLLCYYDQLKRKTAQVDANDKLLEDMKAQIQSGHERERVLRENLDRSGAEWLELSKDKATLESCIEGLRAESSKWKERAEQAEDKMSGMRHTNTCDRIFFHAWLDVKCVDTGCQSLFLKSCREELRAVKAELESAVQCLEAIMAVGNQAIQSSCQAIAYDFFQAKRNALKAATPAKEEKS